MLMDSFHSVIFSVSVLSIRNNVLFICSTWLPPIWWKGVVLDLDTPLSFFNWLNSWFSKSPPWSLWMQTGNPNFRAELLKAGLLQLSLTLKLGYMLGKKHLKLWTTTRMYSYPSLHRSRWRKSRLTNSYGFVPTMFVSGALASGSFMFQTRVGFVKPFSMSACI